VPGLSLATSQGLAGRGPAAAGGGKGLVREICAAGRPRERRAVCGTGLASCVSSPPGAVSGSPAAPVLCWRIMSFFAWC
jgi:hypothetical protein